MSTNKKKLIIFINIILLLFILLFSEIVCYGRFSSFSSINMTEIKSFILPYHFLPVKSFDEYYELLENADYTKNYTQPYYMENYINDLQCARDLTFFRPTNIDNSLKKPPILLFGCSFVWGYGLDENETFSALLQKQTKRIVFNRGLCGKSIVYMLYMLRHKFVY